MKNFYLSNGQSIIIGRQINQSKTGEGDIFEIYGNSQYCVKIYHKNRLNQVLHEKIKYMVNHPPVIPDNYKTGIQLAWPTEIVYDQNRVFAGFVMRHFSSREYFNLESYFAHDKNGRTSLGREFSWFNSLEIANHIAFVITFLHKENVRVGDLKAANIWVSKKDCSVIFLDCDSFQVIDTTGNVTYYCNVATDEYLAPELFGKELRNSDRYYSDLFALGTLIFQILMEGSKPYSAKGSGVVNATSYLEKSRKGLFPYGNFFGSVSPPRGSLPWGMLSEELQNLFIRCFVNGHDAPNLRPAAIEWAQKLYSQLNKLEQCSNNRNHIYLNHCKSCPWCDTLKQHDSEARIDYYPGQPPITKQHSIRSGSSRPQGGLTRKRSCTSNKQIPQTISPILQSGTHTKTPAESDRTRIILTVGICVIISFVVIVFVLLPNLPRNNNPTPITTANSVHTTTTFIIDPLVPTPIDEIPEHKQVWIQIERDPTSKNIKIQLTAARNRGIISKMEVRVTTPNGRVYSEQISDNSGQSTITIKDREDRDRVEVYITFADGTRYKVKDEIVPIRKYY